LERVYGHGDHPGIGDHDRRIHVFPAQLAL
jgi:hypothetical protein